MQRVNIAVDITRPIIKYFHKTTIYVGLFLLFILHGNNFTFTQDYSTSFGQLTEVKTSKHSKGMLCDDFNGDGITDLATYDDYKVNLYFRLADTFAMQNAGIVVQRPILLAATGNFNKDNFADVILLTDNPPTMRVYLAKQSGQFVLSSEIEVDEPFENILISDVNDDKKSDIILFGKRQLGATVFLGYGNGKFKSGVNIFVEYSFNSLLAVHLHRNRNVDLIASNWITNDILIYSGFGRLKFSEPTIIHCNNEISPKSLCIVKQDNIPALIVGFTDQPKFHTYLSDSEGGFQFSNEIYLDSSPDKIISADVNGDNKNDVIILGKSNLSLNVILNNGKGGFDEIVPFSAGRSPLDFSTLHLAKSKNIDIAILDSSNSKIRILFNSSSRMNESKEIKYCVGLEPSGILTADINSDGWVDIITANSGSNNLSVLLNKGRGHYAGQISYDLPLSPKNIKCFNIDDSTSGIVAVNNNLENISVVELNQKSSNNQTYSLPTQGKPDILDIKRDASSKNFQIFVSESENNFIKPTILKFEKIGSGRFIEEYMTVAPKYNSIMALTMDEKTNAPKSKYAFVSCNKSKKKEQVFVVQHISPDQSSIVKQIFSLDASEQIKPMIWFSDLNNDNVSDIILNFGEPENKLYFCIAKNDTTYSVLPFNAKQPIQISSSDRLQIDDFNKDGKMDIVFEDNYRKVIQICYGRGDGTFSQPNLLASTGNIGGFMLSDIDRDFYPELLMTDPLNGVLKIISLHD